jgi:nucleoside-diphosphate-sugar epimerase
MADKKFTVGILRNSTVYGYSPQLRNDLVVNNFVTCALATNKIEIKSDGSPWRPLIDVRDLSDIFIEFLDAESDKINKKVFNIGFQENNVQIKEVLEATRRAIPACEIVFSNKHGSDTRSYQVNFERFKKIFPKIKQKWTIEKSIFDLIKNIKKQNKEKDFYSDKFSRMATIKKLTTTGKLDKNLYWR